MTPGCAACAVGQDGGAWPVRTKAALLLALVAKRQGPALVLQLLPRLLAAARGSPTHTELVRPVLALATLPGQGGGLDA